MPMKRTNYIIIHAIQTAIYLLLAIAMSFIKDKNSEDKIFMGFYGFLIIAVIVCVFILLIALYTRGDDDEE